MKFYIHIGTHKTGTSVIQTFLRKNRKVLKKDNVIYISIPYFWYNICKYNKFKDIPQEIITKSVNYFNKYARMYKIGILSWECLSGNIYKGYTNAHVIAEFLSKVFDRYDTYIILFLRRQDDFLESFYMQMIHEGNILTFEEFKKIYIKPGEGYFDYLHIIRSYEEFFSNKVLLNIYDKKRYSKDFNQIIFDFLLITNLHKNEAFIYVKNTSDGNVGFSKEAYLISQLLYPKLSAQERAFLRNIMQEFLPKKFYESYSFFSPEERLEILRSYEMSNSEIAKIYFGKKDLFDFKIEDDGIKDDKIYMNPYCSLETSDDLKVNEIYLIINTILIKYLSRMEKTMKQKQLKQKVRRFINSYRITRKMKEYLKSFFL